MSDKTALDPATSPKPDAPAEDDAEQAVPRFPPEEEAVLAEEVGKHKATANKLFAASKYDEAISSYQSALSACPKYLHYDLAVLRSNLAACHLKLEQWKEAVKEATTSLDGLDKAERENVEKKELAGTNDKGKARAPEETADQESDVEEEIVSAGATKAGPAVVPEKPEVNPDPEELKRRRKEDIKRIRAKSLMRRARARSELGGWSNLSGAEEDYKTLSMMDNLGPADRKIVAVQLKLLPPRTKAAQEKETAEMWGKLKDLGNGILKPFGLSTDNFQVQKDEKSGGYSMNFKQE